MRRLSWVQNAVQALATDVNDNYETDSDPEVCKEYETQKGRSNKHKSKQKPENPSTKFHMVDSSVQPPLKYGQIEPAGDLRSNSTYSLESTSKSSTSNSIESNSDIWRRASNGPIEEVRNSLSRSSMMPTKGQCNEKSLFLDHDGEPNAYKSECLSSKSKAPRKSAMQDPSSTPSLGTSSTILKGSRKTPISIVLTTPDDEIHTEPLPRIPSTIRKRNPFNETRDIRKSLTPLPPTKRLSKGSTIGVPMKSIDENLLMPPNEYAIDTRQVRQAHDFGDVRGFMINFLNTKGATFPDELRLQMMGLYGIQERDLHPETVAKIKSNSDMSKYHQDEGVVLDDGKQHLKILEKAFRNQMEEVTPRIQKAPVVRPQATAQPTPTKPPIKSLATSPTPRPTPKIPEAPYTTPQKTVPQKPKPTTTLTDDNDLPLAWLAPLISISSSNLAPLPRVLRESRSNPDLNARNGSNHNQKTTMSTPTTPAEERQNPFENAPVRRLSRISGAFDAMRDTVLGRRKTRDGQKTRR